MVHIHMLTTHTFHVKQVRLLIEGAIAVLIMLAIWALAAVATLQVPVG